MNGRPPLSPLMATCIEETVLEITEMDVGAEGISAGMNIEDRIWVGVVRRVLVPSPS